MPVHEDRILLSLADCEGLECRGPVNLRGSEWGWEVTIWLLLDVFLVAPYLSRNTNGLLNASSKDTNWGWK
jgi:hypothetical protein